MSIHKNNSKRTKSEAEEESEHTVKCVLYDRDCIGCLECETCDLDPNKICDNCGKCIDNGESERKIEIDRIYMFEDEYENDGGE